MIGIYHSKDMDGLCCGAIIRKMYPDATLIGYDYGQDFDMSIVEGQDVIMADVSMPMKKMAKIAAAAKSFLWIDHHQTAIDEYNAAVKDWMYPFDAVLDTRLSACELTWKTFFSGNIIPDIVRLVGKYDTWREYGSQLWNTVTLPFQYGLRLNVKTVDDFPVITGHDDDFIRETIFTGRNILRYQDQQNEYLCSHSAFDTMLGDFKAIALNTPVDVSRVLRGAYDPDVHHIMMCFSYNGKEWTVSLRSERYDVHCGEIAKAYGGGGHKGAAGFKTKELPFKI